MKLSQFLVKESGPPGPCPIESDPAFYGANDFAELVHVNVCVGSKQDMSAIRGVGQLDLGSISNVTLSKASISLRTISRLR